MEIAVADVVPRRPDGLLGYVTELAHDVLPVVVPIVTGAWTASPGQLTAVRGICTDLAKVINAPRPFEVDQGVKPSLHFKTATGPACLGARSSIPWPSDGGVNEAERRGSVVCPQS